MSTTHSAPHPDSTVWLVAGIVTDGRISDHPTFQRGREITLEVFFDARWPADPQTDPETGEPFVASGETVGRQFGEPPVEGRSLAPDSAPIDDPADLAIARYRALKQYLEYSPSVSVGTDLGGEVFVRETLTESAPVESLIQSVVPAGEEDEIHIPAMWVAITGGTDTSIVPSRDAWLALELEMTILARYDEYGDREALLDQLSSPVSQL